MTLREREIAGSEYLNVCYSHMLSGVLLFYNSLTHIRCGSTYIYIIMMVIVGVVVKLSIQDSMYSTSAALYAVFLQHEHTMRVGSIHMRTKSRN